VGRVLMAKEIQFPTGYKKLDDFMSNVVWKKFPKAKLYEKKTSFFMKFLYIIGFMWIWQKRFIKGYNTTIGFSVYFSEWVVDNRRWDSMYRTMRHEFIHMLQKNKYKLLFDLSYLFPQVLAVGSVLALLAVWFSNWWLMSLCCLACLAPMPAPWRTKWEIEGYTASMVVMFEEQNGISKQRIDNIIKHFISSDYFFMCPFRSWITRKINTIAMSIRAGKIKGIFLGY
jgi:hypothetical protein